MTPPHADTPDVIADCPSVGGVTEAYLAALVGADRLPEFWRWMRGQTTALCDGRVFNHETRQYEPSQCAAAPHGPIVYVADVVQFLRGGPPLD